MAKSNVNKDTGEVTSGFVLEKVDYDRIVKALRTKAEGMNRSAGKAEIGDIAELLKEEAANLRRLADKIESRRQGDLLPE